MMLKRRTTTSAEKFQTARRALLEAGRLTGPDALGDSAYWTLGSLRQTTTALDAACGGFSAALLDQAHAGELVTVEGPFTDDVLAAAATASQWIDRARHGVGAAASAIDNAHIAIAGLAQPR